MRVVELKSYAFSRGTTMKLYMVVCDVDYEPGYKLGVFSSPTLAGVVKQNFLRRMERGECYADYVSVVEFFLDMEYLPHEL